MYFSSERTHCLMDGMAILLQARGGDTRAFSSVIISDDGKVAEGFFSSHVDRKEIPFRVAVNDKGTLTISNGADPALDKALALVGGGYLAEPDENGKQVIRYHSGAEYDSNRALHLSKASNARIYVNAEGNGKDVAIGAAVRVMNDLSKANFMVGHSSDYPKLFDGKTRRTYLTRMSQPAFLSVVKGIVSEKDIQQFSDGIIFDNMDAIKKSLDTTPDSEFNGLPREVMSLALARHPEIFRSTAITITPDQYERLSGGILLHPLTRRLEALVRGADRMADEYKPNIQGASRDLRGYITGSKGGPDAAPLSSTFYFKNDDLDSIKEVLGSYSTHAAMLTILSNVEQSGIGGQHGGKITVESIADPHRNDDMNLVRIAIDDESVFVSTAGNVSNEEHIPGYTGVSLSWRDDDYRSDKLLAIVNAVEASLLNVGGCLREYIPSAPKGKNVSKDRDPSM